MHKMKIMGVRMGLGMLMTRAIYFMANKPNSRKIKLAMNIPAKMAYTTSELSLNSNGPGRNPCSISAPRKIAVTESPGIPSVSRGINAPPGSSVIR